MEPQEFPSLLSRVRGNYPRTQTTEAACRKMLFEPFDRENVENFVRQVCIWGNDPRRLSKVRQRFNGKEILEKFKKAKRFAESDSPADAIEQITSIYGLGVAFGSKHLMFLAPSRGVILDSFISEELGYPLSKQGYASFVNDCLALRKFVHKAKVINPLTGRGRWRPCDIEGVLYQKVVDLRSA